jgi:hypothetical protein
MTDLAFEPVLVRPRHRVVRILVCSVVLLGLVVWGVTTAGRDAGNGLRSAFGQGFGTAIADSGAFNAVQVANVAHAQGIAIGSVTMAEVQRQVPSTRWVPATVASTNLDSASLDVASDYVATATEIAPGDCSYGLVVSSASAAVVAADWLPGPGVYASFPGPPGAPCAVADTQTSGWVKVSSADLSELGIQLDPVSG